MRARPANVAVYALGFLALGFLAALILGALGALLFAAGIEEGAREGAVWLILGDPYLWRVVRFTLLQAGLSALLSIGLAIPVARAVSRRRKFLGRAALLRLFALPLALPALVVVLGIVEVWGRQGWLSMVLKGMGLTDGLPGIYGLGGILLAHVFFNLPLAVRLMVMLLDRIPGENWRLAAQLGMRSGAIFRLLEWPALRAGLPGVLGLVFMLCVASFTVVLTLGGGPAATTVEVAIYQALRFDFDPFSAVILSLVQLGMTVLLLGMGARLGLSMTLTAGLGRKVERPDTEQRLGKTTDFIVIFGAALFVLLPLIAVVGSALGSAYGRLFSEAIVWQAVATSLEIGLAAACLCMTLAWSLLGAAHKARRTGMTRHDRRRWLDAFIISCEQGGNIILVMPPIVLGAGWFVLLRGFGETFALAPVVVVTINGLMALPYALRILGPAQTAAAARHDRLCEGLGMTGWNRWRLVDWPILRPSIGLAFAFAMVLSLGDLGAVALFGSQDLTTLPLLILQRMGSYRTADAVGLAVILMVFCLLLIAVAERVAEKSGDTINDG